MGEEDEEFGYGCVAFDPGGTTGWAVMSIHPDAMTGDPDIPVLSNVLHWEVGEFIGRQEDQVDEAIKLINTWPSARLVTEAFKVRQLNAELSPAEVNAVLRWAVRPRYFVEQNPGVAMDTVTDARLKAWGYWVPGKPHGRDALRHAITFLKRQKERAMKAWWAGRG